MTSRKNMPDCDPIPFAATADRRLVVIADTGDSATIIVVPSDRGLDLGSRISHHGGTWRITGRRPLSRAFIAEPVVS